MLHHQWPGKRQLEIRFDHSMLVIRCSRVNTFVSLVRTEGAGTRFRNLDGLRDTVAARIFRN